MLDSRLLLTYWKHKVDPSLRVPFSFPLGNLRQATATGSHIGDNFVISATNWGHHMGLVYPDRSDLPRSATVEPPPGQKEWGRWGKLTGHWIPIVGQSIDCPCPGVLTPGHVPGYLMTPLGHKDNQSGQTCSLWQTLQNSMLASLKSHFSRQCLLRNSASMFSSEANHWGRRNLSFLLMVWCHDRRLFLHKIGEWILHLSYKGYSYHIIEKQLQSALGLTNCSQANLTALSSSFLMCFLTSFSNQSCWKCLQQLVLGPPILGLASDQMWSVGLGCLHRLTLLHLKLPETHHSKYLFWWWEKWMLLLLFLSFLREKRSIFWKILMCNCTFHTAVWVLMRVL